MAIIRATGQTPQAAGGTGITSIQVTLPQNIVAGNVIIAVGKSRNGGITTFSDNLANTWARDVQNTAVADNNVAIGCAKNITVAGACTITFSTTAAANRMGLSVEEYSGFTGGAVFDQSASAIGTSVSPASGATPTTTAADELLIGGLSVSGFATSVTWTNSFSLLAESMADGRHSSGDRIVAATGAYNATATLSASDNWCMVIATYKMSGGTVALAGSVSVVSAAVAAAGVLKNLAGSVSVVSAAVAAAGVLKNLAGSVSVVSAAVAAAGVLKNLAGSVSVVSAAVANLIAAAGLAGICAITSAAGPATIRVIKNLSCVMQIISSAVGTLAAACDFPVYAPRTKQNVAGVIYNPLIATTIFAEDVTLLDAEVVKIEEMIGCFPKGVFTTLTARLINIEARITALGG